MLIVSIFHPSLIANAIPPPIPLCVLPNPPLPYLSWYTTVNPGITGSSTVPTSCNAMTSAVYNNAGLAVFNMQAFMSDHLCTFHEITLKRGHFYLVACPGASN